MMKYIKKEARRVLIRLLKILESYWMQEFSEQGIELAMWFDTTREEILKILSSICEETGVRGLYFHR